MSIVHVLSPAGLQSLTTRIRHKADKAGYPCTVDFSVRHGKRRTNNQNRTQFMWYKEAGEQGGMTAKEYRALCKLSLGVPILRSESEDFREVYDRVIRPLDYESKLALMVEPLDWPITRLMGDKQKAAFLDEVFRFLTVECGFTLTIPNEPPIEVYG